MEEHARGTKQSGESVLILSKEEGRSLIEAITAACEARKKQKKWRALQKYLEENLAVF